MCRRFSGRDITFELTFFSHDPEIAHRMSGRRDAHWRICRAIYNLAAQNLKSSVSVVVTRDNVVALADTIGFLAHELGVRELTLSLFRTPVSGGLPTQAPPGGMFQHPSFDLLQQQLGQLSERLPPGSGERLCLLGCPPCQISLDLARAIARGGGLSLSLAPPAIAASRSLHDACQSCSLRRGCGFIDGRYPEHLPLLPPDTDRALSVTQILGCGRARHDSLHNLLADLHRLARGGDLIAVQHGDGPDISLRSYRDGFLLPRQEGGSGDAVTLHAFIGRATTALLIRPDPMASEEPLAKPSGTVRPLPADTRSHPLEAAARLGTVILCTQLPHWNASPGPCGQSPLPKT